MSHLPRQWPDVNTGPSAFGHWPGVGYVNLSRSRHHTSGVDAGRARGTIALLPIKILGREYLFALHSQSFSLFVVSCMTYTLLGISVVTFEVSSCTKFQVFPRTPSWWEGPPAPLPKNFTPALGAEASSPPVRVQIKFRSPKINLYWRQCITLSVLFFAASTQSACFDFTNVKQFTMCCLTGVCTL